MIGYFPKPYKDELYYSILARYHSHIGSTVKSNTLNELIGRAQLSDFELPVGVNKLVCEVSQFSNYYSLDYFIDNHTIIPFVKVFKNEDWLNKLHQKQFKNSHKDSLFGKLKEDVKSKEHLYYCSQCLKAQYEKYGEGYWKTIHQIPGVLICTKHHIPLSKYPVPLDILKLRSHTFVLPTLNDINIQNDKYNIDVIECLINLAEDVEYVLELESDILTEEYLYKKYETLFQIKGIAYPNLNRHKKLNELVLNYYSIEFLELLNSSFKVNDNSSWLKFTNGVKVLKHLHPIRHLLLIRSLCGSARNFFENEYTYEPFGKGPWICMNPLANHYLEEVVEKVDISIHQGNREVQGDMICSCGFIYRLRAWEKSPLEVKYFSNRIMKKGHIWEKRFDELLRQNLTMDEIAQCTNLSRPTIRKLLRDKANRYNNKIQKEKKRNEEIYEKTKKYKKMWLDLRVKYPTYGRQELNNKNRAIYAWLRKYDVDWLEVNSPEPKLKYNPRKGKKDLQKADTEFLIKAKEIVKEWPNYEKIEKKLVRKSIPRIAHLIGLGKSLSRKRDQLQLTFNYLDSAHETVKDFQKRRVRNLLEIKFKDEIVSVNKVAEAVGVRKKIREGSGDEIKEYIEYLVEKHNNNHS